MAVRVVSEGQVRIIKTTVDAECRGLALVVNPTGMIWRLVTLATGAPSRRTTLAPETKSTTVVLGLD